MSAETDRRWSLIPLAFVASLSACAAAAPYRRPDAPVPSAWVGRSDAGIAAGPRWWAHFGSAELNALIERGAGRNFELQAALARVEEARAQAEVAGAPLYPSVALAGNASAGTGPSGSRVSGVFAQASYEVDFWGRNRAAASSAAAGAEASAFDAETVTVTLEAAVANTYFGVLSLQERVRLARQIADDAQRVLTLVQAQAEGGIASELEVEQQRNLLATFEAATPGLQQQLETSKHRLAVLTGQAPEVFRVAEASAMRLSIPEIKAGLPAAALGRRPDLRAAEARLASAHFDVDRARAAFFPSFTLTSELGVGNTALSSFFPPAAIANVVAGLLQPIFAGGALRGRLRYDQAHAVELAATYRQTVISALEDVENALTDVNRSRELEAVNQVAVESARRASTLARARFEAGTVDFLTVLTAERTLYQGEDSLLTTRLQRLEAAVDLFRALGGGFEAQTPSGRSP